MSKIDNVTIAIPTLNEEKNLLRCIQSLTDFRHICIIDSGSTDRTRQIAQDHFIDVIDFKWDGKFPKKRNWYLTNIKIKTDWVLFLDADELLNTEFVQELRKVLKQKQHDAYWLSYNNYFQLKRMKFGLQQRKLALIRTHLRFEKIVLTGTSDFDMEIHEHPIGYTSTGKINTKIDHYDYKGLSHFIKKHISYAEWEVERIKNYKYNTDHTSRQKIKYFFISWSIFPILYFLFDYMILLRFLDGRVGISYSFYKMFYFKMIGDMLKEK